MTMNIAMKWPLQKPEPGKLEVTKFPEQKEAHVGMDLVSTQNYC